MNNDEEDAEIDNYIISNKINNKHIIGLFQNLLKRTEQSINLWEDEIKYRKYVLTDYEKHLLNTLYDNKKNLQTQLNNRMLG